MHWRIRHYKKILRQKKLSMKHMEQSHMLSFMKVKGKKHSRKLRLQ